MKRKLRMLALTLATLIFVSAFVACAEDKEKNNVNTDGIDYADDLPELDYDGATINVFYRDGDWVKLYECTGDIETNDIVYTAVYERNAIVSKRLNIEFEWLPSSNGGLSETKKELVNILSSFVDDYDFFLLTNNTMVSTGMNAYLYDFNSAPYIDLDKEYWWDNCMEEISFDGKTYNYLVGDMLLQNFLKMSAFYFNSSLIQKYLQMTPEDMYALVDNGQWTIERMSLLVSKCYRDLNGDGSANEGDLFGLPIAGSETTDQLLLSTDIEFYSRKKNGYIEVKMLDNADVYTLCEQMTDLVHNNEGTYIQQKVDGSSGFDSFVIQDFSEGKYVFLAQRFTAAFTDSLREMQDDYGIIPYPTLKEGDEYVSYIQDSSTSVACSYALKEDRFNRACAVLEALNSQAHTSVKDKFYEYALKAKNVRDDYDSPRMIDIIYKSATKYFLSEYSSEAGNILGTMSSAVLNKSVVSTLLGSKESASQTSINNFIKKCQDAYGA